MPATEHMLGVVAAYAQAFARDDAEAIAALFAEDAIVEDPVGSAPIVGRAAILAFYARATAMGARLELTGPVRTTQDAAAFAFQVRVPDPHGVRIDVIDIFAFDTAGRIARMSAYWGPGNVISASQGE